MHWLIIQVSVNTESFITLSTKVTKLRCFTHSKSAVETLLQIVSTIQRNAVSANVFWDAENAFRHRSLTLVKLFVRLGTALLIGSTKKLSHIFVTATFNSETVSGFGWFQNSFVRLSPETRYLYSVQIWRVIRWPLFLFKQLLTVVADALLRDTCNARRAPCILLNLPLRLAAVGCILRWSMEAEINKQLQLRFATTLALTLRHRDVIVV